MIGSRKYLVSLLSIIVLTLSSCGDDKSSKPKSPSVQNGTNRTANGITCRAIINQATINYAVNGLKLELTENGVTSTLDRITGYGNEVYGVWGPVVSTGNGYTTSMLMTVGTNSITNNVECTSNGQKKTVSVTVQAEITATQIIVKESKSDFRDME